MTQQIEQQRVIAIPFALVVQGHNKKIGLLQVLQHGLAIYDSRFWIYDAGFRFFNRKS